MQITPQEAAQVGEAIFFNECSNKTEYLVWWSPHEEFISLGIGHFIWHSKPEPFEETFPSLVAFLEKKGVQLPHWLNVNTPCPWHTRDEFLRAAAQQKKEELRVLLRNTTALQAEFIAARAEHALTAIQQAALAANRDKIAQRIASLKTSTRGKFALIDYINFKGTGLLSAESYQGSAGAFFRFSRGCLTRTLYKSLRPLQPSCCKSAYRMRLKSGKRSAGCPDGLPALIGTDLGVIGVDKLSHKARNSKMKLVGRHLRESTTDSFLYRRVCQIRDQQ